LEYRLRRYDGEYQYILDRGSPFNDLDGNFAGFIGSCYDITERKQAEEALQEMNLALINAMPGIAILNSEGRYERVNEAYAQMVGYVPSELIGKGWAPTVTPDDMKLALEAYQRMLSEGDGEFEARAVRKDGSLFYKHVLMAKRTAKDGTFLGHHCFMRDITERKQAEEERARLLKEVQDSNARLQHLSRRMLEVQEEERRRIARELHDQTGQSLTSLLVGLRVLEDLPTLGRAQTQASDLRKITMDALKEVKRLAMGLRPALLDDLGLEAALKRLVKESAQTYRVSMDLHIKGLTNRRLPPPVETGFYRIAQEALTNMGRHAAAKNVSVLLTCSESSVKLIIEDDGCGFDVEKALRLPGSSKHLGLLGMHERVSLLNGTISVESTPDSGTTIYVQLPLEARPS
jgi:PAS domain S-box-containing protein